MSQPLIESINHTLTKTKAIKFAYLFGSQARGKTGPLSDIDIAVYLDKRHNLFLFRLHFQEEIDRQLKGRRSSDLVILNNAPLVLQYEIIKNGKVLKESKPQRIQFETRVLRNYLDTEKMRYFYASSLKTSFQKERHLGK